MRPVVLAAVASAAGFAIWAMWQAAAMDAEAAADVAEEDQGGVLDDAVETVKSMMTGNDEALASGNVQAFLMLIRSGESSARQDAYQMIVYGNNPGPATFSSFANHPRVKKPTKDGSGRVTSAAGAYQITATTWDDLGGIGRYGDFSPASQDRAAVDLIRRRGALSDVLNGRWRAAVRKLRQEWTSLPGAAEQGYGMDRALAVLQRNGYQGEA